MSDDTTMTEEKLFQNLDLYMKSRAEKKRMEYIKNLKEKRSIKKKEKKKKKQNGEENEKNEELNKEIPVKNDINDLLKEENIEIEYVDEDPISKSKISEDF